VKGLIVAAVLALALVLPADAKPAPTRKATPRKATRTAKAAAPIIAKVKRKLGSARVTIGRFGELRPAREAVGRRDEPLTAEEETAKQIAKLLRGPLRYGTTGLFVADARSGEPLFAVNAEDPLNPASNVKMISTATALELLGPEFRYPTRLLGAAPQDGVVHGDVFLLGSFDPTLTAADLDEVAIAAAQRGITSIQGNVVVGSDPTRDGIYRSIIPIEINAGEPGKLAIATTPAGADHVVVNVVATTSKRAQRPRLTYKVETTKDAAGRPRITVTIGGVIGKGGETMYPLVTRERTATAAYAMRAALRAHSIQVSGDLAIEELGDFVGNSVGLGSLPVELGRHESARLADIVSRVNKWSVNWLADRVIMTAAALANGQPPSMELALDAMYAWLARHPHLAKTDLVVDTGSGLSYRTQITAHELASIVRSAGGFDLGDSDPGLSRAWLESLSVSGTDGTLRHRFLTTNLRGRIRGKTGTLSTAIALSGVLDIDPQRPLVFSLITNGDVPLSKGYVRRAHELVVGALCTYLAKTAKVAPPVVAPPVVDPASQVLPFPTPTPPPPPTEDVEETEPDAALDAEAAAAGAP
jgi:D-alanyl-D-alanine carboxypeptidase/D-alanyl-D-alanine-endopeptidase (penicillin-binding protein 4)